MLAVRTDEVLIARAVASVGQREVRVRQAARAHLPVNQLPRGELAGTPLKPIKNATVVIWVAEWSIGRQELMVHGVHRRRHRATQREGFHVDQRAHLDEAHVQQKAAVAIECCQHRSRDAGDPPGVLAPLHRRVKGTGEHAVAVERQTDKDHVTTRTLRQPRYANASFRGSIRPTTSTGGSGRPANASVSQPMRPPALPTSWGQSPVDGAESRRRSPSGCGLPRNQSRA